MLYFKNPGEADLNALTTLGVNVKDDEDSAIGKFGTGFKYSVAGILRCGGSVVVYVGLDRYEFRKQTKEIRGKNFDMVVLVGPKGDEKVLGFTTDIGKHWEPWMFYRELRCNATDEDGDLPTKVQTAPEKGYTLICVDCDEVEEVHHKASLYFITTEPIHELEEVNVHRQDREKPTNAIFYKGVKVGEWRRTPTFVYDFRGVVTLTEDRTVLYPHMVQSTLTRNLRFMRHERDTIRLLTCGEGFLEDSLEFGNGGSASENFLNVAEQLVKGSVKNANKTLRTLLVSTRNFDPYIWVDPDVVQAKQLMKAEKIVKDLGYDTENVRIRIVANLPHGVIGQALLGDIYLSSSVFEMGTKMLAGTIFEEMVHIKHGHMDSTREMQNFLVDRIMTMYERQTGEPI